MEPVHAAWTRFGREIEDGPGTLVTQEWTDDDIVIHLRLEIMSAQDTDKGDYCCRVKNQYGVLEKKVGLEVEDIDEEYGEEEKVLEMKRELNGLFHKQMKIYSAMARVISIDEDLFHQTLHQVEKKLN
eukprot:TRINITY_DN34303_c0_g1_i1.p1 TRINITY_DN34303_c0_g1~~TRINITY_DN34303_c0_g1_i1.p1  ORF type:complete len:143 (-),score=40.60 TRINITY_DN34303_c0_g1_i1:55-438(-)